MHANTAIYRPLEIISVTIIIVMSSFIVYNVSDTAL